MQSPCLANVETISSTVLGDEGSHLWCLYGSRFVWVKYVYHLYYFRVERECFCDGWKFL